MTLGSIPAQAMRRCVSGKDTYRLFPNETKQFTGCGGLRNNSSKKALCVVVVGQTQSLVHTNKRTDVLSMKRKAKAQKVSIYTF